jgi:inner membrane protein
MDNLCHTLVGAAFGEAGLKTRTRFGTATLMIASNLPDLDVLAFVSSTPAVAIRRGWTHGVLGQALLPIVLTGIMLLIARKRSRRPSSLVASARQRLPSAGASAAQAGDAPPVRAIWLLALSYLGVMTHVLLDLLNNYGVRLLTPFERGWFYGDALFIIDPWLWIALGTGVWLARLRARPGPARRALFVAAVYVAAMIVSARVARGIVDEAWRTARGDPPQALMVGPAPITPLERRVIVDAGDHYETGTFEWFPARVTFDPVLVPKNDRDPRVIRAREAPQVRAFLIWSRFPYWTLESAPAGTRVSVSDLRFAGQNGVRFTQTTIVPRGAD